MQQQVLPQLQALRLALTLPAPLLARVAVLAPLLRHPGQGPPQGPPQARQARVVVVQPQHPRLMLLQVPRRAPLHRLMALALALPPQPRQAAHRCWRVQDLQRQCHAQRRAPTWLHAVTMQGL